ESGSGFSRSGFRRTSSGEREAPFQSGRPAEMDGTALVLCGNGFRTDNGKTAHGLVRGTERYRILGVVDASCAGEDAGALLDGKRTTARMLTEGCRAAGMNADMIYTGQTGWLQGGRFGFILDATPNDFVSGELEHAIVTCAAETFPDVIFLEGQSSLRNPSGP